MDHAWVELLIWGLIIVGALAAPLGLLVIKAWVERMKGGA
jgi:hypothetical protein